MNATTPETELSKWTMRLVGNFGGKWYRFRIPATFDTKIIRQECQRLYDEGKGEECEPPPDDGISVN